MQFLPVETKLGLLRNVFSTLFMLISYKQDELVDESVSRERSIYLCHVVDCVSYLLQCSYGSPMPSITTNFSVIPIYNYTQILDMSSSFLAADRYIELISHFTYAC
jgi:hypothetical protein